MTLHDYCHKMQLKISVLSRLTGISYGHLYKIQSKTDFNPSVKFINAIYRVTKEKFGVGLRPEEYLSNYLT